MKATVEMLWLFQFIGLELFMVNRIINDVDFFEIIEFVNIYYNIENSYLSEMGKSIFIF
ncbi:hypothetical protein CSC2_13060 [Clostridium zeae]|uniref:Uncharacterized protein n=1 Tax=Clostridium zeae TaxID=2759022 RepID=A0ABQ1E7T2_9CLOT|nr:hypothetical protein CSC2_13060 [Clostridium zeae]